MPPEKVSSTLPLDPAFVPARASPQASFAETLRFHHLWLHRKGLLGRPWFVFGSAPDPALPESLPPDTVYAYVKHAGRGAKARGLPSADITFMTPWKARERSRGLHLGHVLRLRKRELTIAGHLARRWQFLSPNDSEILRSERDDYIIHTFGTLFRGLGKDRRPSNGVAMACFALAHGIPHIILSGLSLDRIGYDHGRADAVRRHTIEDHAALSALSKSFPQVQTTEPNLNEHTGLPLYVAGDPAPAVKSADL